MIQTSKIILNFIKYVVVVFLLIVVFNFYFDRANKVQNKQDIEDIVNSLEEQIESSRKLNDDFKHPIQRRFAAEYTIIENSLQKQGNEEYRYICAVSNALGQSQRAQTIINIGIEAQELDSDNKMIIYLAPDSDLCIESRVIGIGYYVPTSDGWNVISGGKWKWLIRTSNMKVTPEQIEATKLYVNHKEEFKQNYGSLDYSDKLNAFVEEKLAKKPKYVTAGMWNDDFIKE